MKTPAVISYRGLCPGRSVEAFAKRLQARLFGLSVFAARIGPLIDDSQGPLVRAFSLPEVFQQHPRIEELQEPLVIVLAQLAGPSGVLSCGIGVAKIDNRRIGLASSRRAGALSRAAMDCLRNSMALA